MVGSSHSGISFRQLIFPCFCGAIIGLIVLNYWHALRCENDGMHDANDDYFTAMERRLKRAEYESQLNDVRMQRLKSIISTRLITLDTIEVDKIVHEAENRAVSDALRLQSMIAIPFPSLLEEDISTENVEEFEENGSENINGLDMFDGEAGGFLDSNSKAFMPKDDDKDDYYNQEAELQGKGVVLGGSTEGVDDLTGPDGQELMDDEKAEESLEAEHIPDIIQQDDASKLSDKDRTKRCAEWLIKYDVKVGVNWGGLPMDLQHKWLSFHCDYFLAKDNFQLNMGHSESGNDVPTSSPTKLKDLLTVS
jgi:hypothetical protein